MSNQDLLESIALQIADGDAVAWEAEAGSPGSAVVDNLYVLDKLARTLRDQDAKPDMPDSWGPLQIVSHLGSGASADVYRAHDPNLQRDVALKLFRDRDEESQQRLLEEGRMMARVQHPNVVQVFGAEQHDGRTGLWMELVEGKTLDEIASQQGPMSAAEAAVVGRQLCAALAAVHKKGLLFRDIKLQNVIRERGGTCKLTDFGSGMDRQRPDSGRISGTPFYIAPELFDDKPASVQSDIYALGALLYHLVSGAFPVEADSIDELQDAHKDGARPLVDLRPDLPADFVTAVEKAIATEPDERYASPGKFSAALRGFGEYRHSWTRRTAAIFAMLVFAALVVFHWPAQYQLEATLYRVGEDGSRSALAGGSTVAVGDNLVLQVSASIPMYVYVFNEDARGNAWGLFPLTALGESNPLAAGESHTLPGAGLTWTVDSAGLVERIHILASPEPDERVEARFRALPQAILGGSGLSARGVGSVRRQEGVRTSSAAPMIQAAEELAGTAETVSGVTYEVIELRNPDN